jgi:hypothetical protein
MSAIEIPRTEAARFELRYRSLSPLRCGYAFPCDANGQVDLDRLSERARGNYLHARAVHARAAVGFDLQRPEVQPAQLREPSAHWRS